VTGVDVENSSQSNSELAANAGNYHMDYCNANNCTTTVCGNTTSQPNAIVNVKSDVFTNNSPVNELTLPNFYDSSNQISQHFLRDLGEYYRINNFPKRETIGDKVTKPYARMRKKAKDRREWIKTGNKI